MHYQIYIFLWQYNYNVDILLSGAHTGSVWKTIKNNATKARKRAPGKLYTVRVQSKIKSIDPYFIFVAVDIVHGAKNFIWSNFAPHENV